MTSRRKSARLIAGSVATLVAACSTDVPPPVLLAVRPARGSYSEATPVTIVGRAFYLGVDARFDAAAPALEGSYEAELGGVPLQSVRWIDPEHLTAVVPAGMALGTHPLRVVRADGRAADLDAAFTVDVDDEDAGEESVPARLVVLAVSPASLTADGDDESEILVRLETQDGAPLVDERLTATASAGGLDDIEDLGDGRYEVRYHSPLAAGGGAAVVTVSAERAPSVSAAITISLVPSCGEADDVVASLEDLEDAVAAANAAGVERDICIETGSTLALDAPIVVTAPAVRLRGEARTSLRGDALDAAATGVHMSGASARVQDLELMAFAGTALALAGDGTVVERTRFVECGVGVHVTGANVRVGPDNQVSAASLSGIIVEGTGTEISDNRFFDNLGTAALQVGRLVEAGQPWIRRNLFYRNATAVYVDDADDVRLDGNTFASQRGGALIVGDATGMLVRNNIFAYNGGAAVSALDATLAEAPAYNDFFMNGTHCAGCSLGPSLFVDPLFVDAVHEDFRLSVAPSSPCIDAGIDVGYPYSGAAPDLGALEAG